MSMRRPKNLAVPLLLAAAGLGALLVGICQSDARSRLLAQNTMALAFAVCAASLPIGFLLAWLLTRTDLPGRRTCALALLALLFTPLYIQAAAWDAGFGQVGWFSATHGAIADPLLSGWRGAVWIHSAASIPWVALLTAVGLRYVDPQWEEQALLEGSRLQVWLRVTVVAAAPSLAVAALWVLVSTAGEMTVTDLCQVRTYAEELYTGFALGDDLASAWRRSLPGVLMAVWLAMAALTLAAMLAPRRRSAPVRSQPTVRLGRWRIPATAWGWGCLLLLVAAPLANLCYQAGAAVAPSGDQPLRDWSFERLVRALVESPQMFRKEWGWTIILGVVAATGAIVLGAPLAWRARRGGRKALPAVVATGFCLAAPGPLVGLGVIWLLNRPDVGLLVWLYDRTICAPALALLIRSLPVAILICWYAFRGISTEVLEAAAIDGAGPWTRLTRIALPQRAGALAAAWLAALAVAAGDLGASILVVPPGVTTVSIRVFGLMHAGVRAQEAALCLTHAAGYVVIAGLVVWLLSRLNRPAA